MKSYGKTANLQYRKLQTVKPKWASKKSRGSPSAWSTYVSATQKATSIGANIADLTHFLASYLSGEPNVSIHPTGTTFASTIVINRGGHPPRTWAMFVPAWDTYDIPLKVGFDKYRVYRNGIWHEAMHIRFTPEELFAWGDNVKRQVFNIIEDRRIEDLGVEYWTGYAPERLYAHAYGWALRPAVDTIQDKRKRIAEAFLQRMVVGKVKGKLDKAEADLIEQTAKYAEKRIGEANKETDKMRKIAILRSLVDEVVTKLDLKDPNDPNSAPLPDFGSRSPWEATFTPRYTPTKSPEEIEEDMEEFFKEEEKEAEDEPSDTKKDPKKITKQDVEIARQGSAEVKSEYSQATQQKKVDPEIAYWSPIVSYGNPNQFRDTKFIRDMDAHLRKWQTGYETVVGKTGARLSIPDYIRHQDEPFATRLKRSVMGKKMLILADFSGSMASRQNDYKRALISAIEVLNKVGSNIALFGFGGDPAQGDLYFRVKSFEEPRWTSRHSSKLAAVEADFGSTPLATAYRELAKYVAKHKPDVMVTMTDGAPDDAYLTAHEISSLKKHTKMVAFGLGEDADHAWQMERLLKELGYHSSVAVDDLRELPPKLVKLFIPST